MCRLPLRTLGRHQRYFDSISRYERIHIVFGAGHRDNPRTMQPVQGYVRYAAPWVARALIMVTKKSPWQSAWYSYYVKLLTPARQSQCPVPPNMSAISRVVGRQARRVRGGDAEDRMRTPSDGPTPVRGRPGPKPRGRSVVPLTITITPVQRAALVELAAAEKTSVSAIARRFITTGLAADAAR
jgi:hypothetical protein